MTSALPVSTAAAPRVCAFVPRRVHFPLSCTSARAPPLYPECVPCVPIARTRACAFTPLPLRRFFCGWRTDSVSGVCGTRQIEKGPSARSLCARPGRVDDGTASTMETRGPKKSDPFKFRSRVDVESTRFCDAAIAECASRCDPMSIRKDSLAARLRIVDFRRAIPDRPPPMDSQG